MVANEITAMEIGTAVNKNIDVPNWVVLVIAVVIYITRK